MSHRVADQMIVSRKRRDAAVMASMRLLQLHNAPFFSLVLCSAMGMISPSFERNSAGCQ